MRSLTKVSAGVLGSLVAAQAHAQVMMGGVVRDVRSDHPDFGVIPGAGFGQASGNVAYELGDDGKPVFTGGGYMVETPWTDRSGNPIAPHIYANIGLTLASAPVKSNDAVIDTYDPTLGAYGGFNAGPAPGFAIGAPMPVVTEPTGMPPLSGAHSYADVGTTTISNDIHCTSFSVRDSHTLRINGDIRILCEGAFTVKDAGTVVQFVGDSTLTIYLKGTFDAVDNGVINANTSEPWRVKIINLGTGRIKAADPANFCAEIISPNAPLELADGAQFYGSFHGQSITAADTSGVHLATSLMDNCGNLIADQAGVAGPYSTAGITSASTFNQWFRNVPGVTAAAWHTMELDPLGGGFYEYSTTGFHPIDDMLYGNEGAAHNYYFTFEVAGWFTYEQCSDQMIDIQADDDVWIFVDDTLAIDLGGISARQNQTAHLDRMGLTHGERYKMRLFYAQRQQSRAGFTIRTNIAFESFDSEVPLEPAHD